MCGRLFLALCACVLLTSAGAGDLEARQQLRLSVMLREMGYALPADGTALGPAVRAFQADVQPVTGAPPTARIDPWLYRKVVRFWSNGFVRSAVQSARPGAYGPGFDCRTARLAAEYTICQTPALAAYDQTVSDLFGVHRPADPAAFHGSWTHQRNLCREDVACLLRVYRAWIKSLQAAQ